MVLWRAYRDVRYGMEWCIIVKQCNGLPCCPASKSFFCVLIASAATPDKRHRSLHAAHFAPANQPSSLDNREGTLHADTGFDAAQAARTAPAADVHRIPYGSPLTLQTSPRSRSSDLVIRRHRNPSRRSASSHRNANATQTQRNDGVVSSTQSQQCRRPNKANSRRLAPSKWEPKAPTSSDFSWWAILLAERPVSYYGLIRMYFPPSLLLRLAWITGTRWSRSVIHPCIYLCTHPFNTRTIPWLTLSSFVLSQH